MYWNSARPIHRLYQCNFSHMHDQEITCINAEFKEGINENVEERRRTLGACIPWPRCHLDHAGTGRHSQPAPPPSPPSSLLASRHHLEDPPSTSTHRCVASVVSCRTTLLPPRPLGPPIGRPLARAFHLQNLHQSRHVRMGLSLWKLNLIELIFEAFDQHPTIIISTSLRVLLTE